jgi:neutral ceramidase
MAEGRLKAGVAERDITPPLGSALIGELGERTAASVRTPLAAKALALADDRHTLVLVTLDLFGLHEEAMAEVQTSVETETGLPPAALLVVCSRTRGGPDTMTPAGWAEHRERVIPRVVDVAASAVGNQRDASLGIGHAVLPHLLYNHRLLTRNLNTVTAWLGVLPDEVLAPEGPVDPKFQVIVVRDVRNHLLAWLWHAGADNRFSADDRISADLPALVQEAMDARLGGHVPGLYLPGCIGNVSFHNELETAADAVASAVMAVTMETSSDPRLRLGCGRRRVVLPVRGAALKRSLADIAAKRPEALPYYEREISALQAAETTAIPAAVQLWHLGRTKLVGLPGAPFAELWQALTAHAGADVLVVGNANCYPGPAMFRPSYLRGGLETWPDRLARLGPGSGEFLVDQAIGLMADTLPS